LGDQIAELQSILPGCAALLSQPASLLTVRHKLRRTTATLERAEKALTTILNSKSDANVEVRNRVVDVDFAIHDGTDSIDAALALLGIVRESFTIATEQLPAKARHKRSADHRPIERIDKALLEGFIKHHHRKPPPPGWRNARLPEYTMTVSRKGPFSKIVAICYEAIGELDNSKESTPDRAIREYLRLDKLRRAVR
jgi:hypothetical protein